MKRKIRLLLIDDNPEFALIKAIDANEFFSAKGISVNENQHEKELPAVHNDETGSSKARFKELEEYFELQWLQTPTDIREFKELSHEIEHVFSPDKLGEVGFVPELVCFDYALTGSSAREFLNNRIDRNILKAINPNYGLADFLNKNHNGENEKTVLDRDKSFGQTETVPNTGADANEDNMGCYAGGLIVSMFRNHPCAPIPTTRKGSETVENTDAIYFEWLLRHEFEDAFKERGRPEPKWFELIPFGIDILRKRIKKLVQSSKITPSLTELIELAGGGNVPSETDKRIFTFTSVYGKRELPLDGLFIDEPKENRDAAVTVFAKECLDLHLKNANDGLTKDVLESAIKFCTDLLEQYDKKDKFLERVRFSQLKLKADKGIISSVQQRALDAIYLAKGMIISDKEYKDAFDLRNYNGVNGNLVKRYATLFAMVNLYKRFIEFKKTNADKTEFKGKPYLFTQPEKMDYLLAIYPRPATPLVMPLHENSDGHDNDLKRNTKRVSTDEIGILVGSVLNKIKNGGITKGEKTLLQAYATGIGLSKENFAEWFI